jgi:type II secretory pathway component GspD/PulD (secretin)
MPLRYMAASEFAKRLSTSLESATVKFDVNTNTVFLLASAADIQRAEALQSRLDVQGPEGITVFKLEHADVDKTARTLTAVSMFCEDLHIVPSKRNSSIIVSASTYEQLEVIKAIIRHLDTKPK